MRKPLIALIPAALIAGAASAQEAPEAEPTPADVPQQDVPAEEQSEVEQTQQAAPPPEVETAAAEGTWTRAAAGNRETVSYTSTEGEELFSATCMAGETETGDRILQIKAVSADDTVGAIDLFTSAGNARVTAGPDASPDLAAGLTEPVSRPAYVLASGAGEMRIVSGTRGILIETDPMLKDLIRSCQPDHLARLRERMAPETDDEAEDAGPGRGS